MTIGLVIKGTFLSKVDGGTPLLCGAHDYTSLPKPKGSAFSEIFSEVVRKKETLLSSDANEGQYLATLTSQNDFLHLKLLSMLNFSRESGKFWVVDSLSSHCAL
jgi:hypothetical protein